MEKTISENLLRQAAALEEEAARLRTKAQQPDVRPDEPSLNPDRRSRIARELQQRAILDSATQFAIVAADLDGRVTDWNAGAERIFGWSADEMRGGIVARIFTPEDRSAGRPETEMRLALDQGRVDDERWHLRKDGTRFWASGEMMPLRDEGGAHIGYVKVLRDRTAEHKAGVALRDAEARLRESEDHFRHTVDLSPQVAWTCDPQGNITSYSNRWLQLTGQASGEPLGAGWAKALHPDDLPHTMEIFAASLASGEPVDVDYRINVTGTGNHRWMRARAYPRRDETGTIVRWYGVVEDIHDRRLTEDALKSSEARLRAVIETAPVGILMADETSAITGGNARTEEIVGHPILASRDAASYGEWVAFHADGRRVEAQEYPLARAFTGEERPELECHYQRGDGRRIWTQIVGAPIRDERGYRLGAIVAILDIDKQKRAEQALQALNASLENEVRERTAERDEIWTLSTDLLSVTELGGKFVACNPAWPQALGWSEAELKARPFLDLVHPDDVAATIKETERLAQGHSVDSFENRYRHKDGSYRWLSWNAVPSGTRVFSTTRDVTAFKAQAETLLKAEEQLRQSQKMEAVGQLTGGLAHDFNNLLAGISGSLEMMNARINQGRLRDVEKYMVAAQGATKRAAALTHRLLAFSRRQTLAPKATNVNVLVSGLLDMVQRTVGPGIAVEFVGMAGLWAALVDPSQLENALLNLCINARDAMPEGGKITIETGNRWIDRPGARQLDLPEGQYLSLCVSDTGTGMKPEVIAKAFDPFFTTKPLGEGTGLGLSMIYGFAKQSGGQVRIYSEVGEGTMVCIYVPRHRGRAEVDEAGPETAVRPLAEAGETVLIVDDEPTVRMLVTDVLEDLGYTAIEATDGAGGLRVLQSDARIDLLVTDVGLPGGMNGRQVADAGRVGRPDLKVLFITGFAENALLNNGRLEAGMSVLTKPFAVDTLAARIREMIAK